jgi:hypothetical protein
VLQRKDPDFLLEDLRDDEKMKEIPKIYLVTAG